MPELGGAFLRRPIAHRGLWGAGVPENSLAAARAAIAADYGIECDVQLTSDGEAVVFHDDALDRLCGHAGRVNATAAADLVRMRLRGGDGFVPTLAMLLDTVAGRVPVLIEIKDQDGALGPKVGPLETRVARILASYAGEAAVMGFNPHSLGVLRDRSPERARGLVSCDFNGSNWNLPRDRRDELARLPDFDAVGASFVSHDRADLGNRAVVALRNRGVPVMCWTVRSAAEERAARLGADNITFEAYIPVTQG